MFRSRPTAPNPFGELDPPHESEELDDALAAGHRHRELDLAPVIEERVRGAGWIAYHPVVTCEQLRSIHLAREGVEAKLNPNNGKMVTSKRWTIEPAGEQAIADAATADPLIFDLAAYAVKR